MTAVLNAHRKPTAPQTVLIVEDDAVTRDLFRRQLQKQDWTVDLAENGKVALARLEQCRPSVILLDLMMPEMDGFQFLEALRAQNADTSIPVVVVTARDLSAADRQRLTGSAIQVLRKGTFRIEELVAELRRVTSPGTRSVSAIVRCEMLLSFNPRLRRALRRTGLWLGFQRPDGTA